MSAAPHTPAPTPQPDPNAAGAGETSCVGRVLSLVRKLIDYGKQLAGTMPQRAALPHFARYARPFGSTDLSVILARITAGLRRAAALEAALCQRAASGQDLPPAPIRLPVPRGPRPPRQAAPRHAQPEPQPADQAPDPRLARLPTEEEIAAEVRRRPVGAVIADICRDFGIAPAYLDQAFWNEIRSAIIDFGGNLDRFLANLLKRLFDRKLYDPLGGAGCGWQAAPPQVPAAATGPP